MEAILILLLFILPMLVLIYAIRRKAKQWKKSINIF